MTVSMSPLTVKERWLQRHECDMNGLWRIGASSGQARPGSRRRASPGDVRYWHLADITIVLIHVRFFGVKADIQSQGFTPNMACTWLLLPERDAWNSARLIGWRYLSLASVL